MSGSLFIRVNVAAIHIDEVSDLGYEVCIEENGLALLNQSECADGDLDDLHALKIPMYGSYDEDEDSTCSVFASDGMHWMVRGSLDGDHPAVCVHPGRAIDQLEVDHCEEWWTIRENAERLMREISTGMRDAKTNTH